MKSIEWIAESPHHMPETEPNLAIGTRVRFLAAIPCAHDPVEIGEAGRVVNIWHDDDSTYFVAMDGRQGCVVLEDHELWKLEVVA